MTPKIFDVTKGADDACLTAQKKQAAQKRKRTKTGCLTCRRRRIKCDENHPICANCIRSRRQCDGYKTPLIFRSSDSTSYAFNHFTTSPLAEGPPSYYQHGPHVEHVGYSNTIFTPFPGAVALHTPPAIPLPTLHALDVTLPGSTHIHGSMIESYHPALSSSHSDGVGPDYFTRPHAHSELYSNDVFPPQNAQYTAPYGSGPAETNFSLTSANVPTHLLNPPQFPYQRDHASHYTPVDEIPPALTSPLGNAHLAPWTSGSLTELHATLLPARRLEAAVHSVVRPAASLESITNRTSHQEGLVTMPESSTPTLVYGQSEHDPHPGLHNIDELPPMRQTFANEAEELPVAYTSPHPSSPLDLDPYFSRDSESLLNNPYTKSTFQQFVQVTGPMLTAFARSSPYDQPLLYSDSIPFAYAGLWSYTMPMLSLKSRPLLHGMLALASLQTARRTGGSTTPSWKHYTHSWRKVHSAVRDPQMRLDVTTFAATMLLAYYEVATADHSRWNMHLSGAAQLIREMDLAGMTKQVRLMTRQRDVTGISNDYVNGSARQASNIVLDQSLNRFSDYDILLVREFTGESMYIDDSGNVWRNEQRAEDGKIFTSAELMHYESVRDLFWWYMRHDLIHALVGGTDLLLEYRYWTECPPRAMMGNGVEPYGSFDHLLLLMGRLVRWIKKDRSRKRIAFDMASTGAQTIKETSNGLKEVKKTPSLNVPDDTSPKQASKTNSNRPGPAPKAPSFYGMAPTKGKPPMPQAFESTKKAPATPESEESDLNFEQATAEAFKEWMSIRQAFDTFANALGPDFEPLSDAGLPVFNTPFGPMIHYRTNVIACVMAWYYLGLIVAHRAHPSMPPFATIAVGAAAQQTAGIANIVGRIIAGIRPDLSEAPLKPGDAGPISDLALPLFFAAVQYRDAEQRAWSVDWLRRAESVTAFASIALCANGCESAWVRQAEMGRGPPYERTMGIQFGELEGEAREKCGDSEKGGRRADGKQGKNSTVAKRPDRDHEGRFIAFQRGEQIMRGYSLYSVTTEDFGRLSLGA